MRPIGRLAAGWRLRVKAVGRIVAFAWPFLRPRRLAIWTATGLSFLTWGLGTVTALVTAIGVQVLLNGGRLEPGAAPSASALPAGNLDQIATSMVAWATRLTAGRGPTAVVLLISGLLVLLTVATALSNLGNRALWAVIRLQTLRAMQVDLFDRLCHLSMTFYTRERIGGLLARMQRDLGDLVTVIQQLLTSMVRAPIMFVFFLAILFRTNLSLTLITLGVASLTLFGFQLIGRLQRRQATVSYQLFSQFMSIAQETLTSIRVVKAYGAEDFVVEKFRQAASAFARLEAARDIVRLHLPESLSPVLNILTLTVLAAAGSQQVAAGNLTQEGLLMFLGVTVLMFASAVTIGNAVIGIYEAAAAADRVFEIVRERPEVVDGHRRAGGFQHTLALRQVCFTYGDNFRLSDINLEVREGERVAVVGPSGSGKSTLIDLILRLYDPTAGYIELDGVDIRDFTLVTYRALFGVVSQESLLFNDTLRNNIAYGRPDLSWDAIQAAAKIADAHDFITQLPLGYETPAGDRGIRLSGGQRQRIAIARALATRPRILILDEATSSLDSEAERQVQRALEAATANLTTLIVAHRLSTVQQADTIVVLDNGRIVERGSHASLMALNGLYRHLYEVQTPVPAPGAGVGPGAAPASQAQGQANRPNG